MKTNELHSLKELEMGEQRIVLQQAIFFQAKDKSGTMQRMIYRNEQEITGEYLKRLLANLEDV